MRTVVMAMVMLLGCLCVASVHAQSVQKRSSAQQQNTPAKVMRGCVCDENNVPMSGVVVRNLTSKKNAVTDKEGRFSLPCHGQGDRVTLTFIGGKGRTGRCDELCDGGRRGGARRRGGDRLPDHQAHKRHGIVRICGQQEADPADA